MDEEFDHWDQVADETDQKVNQLVRMTAFQAQAIAQRESRVDTGFMKNAWYVRTEDDSSFGGGASAIARRYRAKHGRYGKDIAKNVEKLMAITALNEANRAVVAAQLFPEVPATPHNEAWVVGGANYTIYNEFGTVHMAAKPMIGPAIARVKGPFLRALAIITNGGAG